MEYITHVETNKRTLFWTFIRYIRYAMSFLCLNMQKKTGKQQKKYTVAVCAIFKNESVFLKEWLEYHLLIGVEHFYLYNNFSEDNYQDILAPYIEKGQVTLTEWPVQFGQLPAYKDCFQKAKDETRWIAYIDLDEFICLRREQNIRNWIQKYDKYPTVYVNWKQFGTSGRLQHDDSQRYSLSTSLKSLYTIGLCGRPGKENPKYRLITITTVHTHNISTRPYIAEMPVPPTAKKEERSKGSLNGPKPSTHQGTTPYNASSCC